LIWSLGSRWQFWIWKTLRSCYGNDCMKWCQEHPGTCTQYFKGFEIMFNTSAVAGCLCRCCWNSKTFPDECRSRPRKPDLWSHQSCCSKWIKQFAFEHLW
jgi:hypothetical protein